MRLYRATVTDISDPDNLGRIRVRIVNFSARANVTPWVWPCSPFASVSAGLVALPQIGDHVWVGDTADGTWVCLGYFWTDNTPIPSEAGPRSRVITSPSGHQIKLDDDGAVEISHASGATITLNADGGVTVTVAEGSTINLGGAATESALLGESFQTKFNDLVQTFNSHTHTVPQAASGTMQSFTVVSAASPSGSDDLCEKVKAE